MNDLFNSSEFYYQKVIIYDLCYSDTWIERITEYKKKTGLQMNYGAVILIRFALSYDYKFDVDYLIQYVKTLSSDLFHASIIGNKNCNEIICISLTEKPDGIIRDVIVEKCCVLYERLTTILGLDLQIGIGRIKSIDHFNESLVDANLSTEKSSFSVIHYSDLFNDNETGFRGTVVSFLEYLQANYSRPISLNQIAKEVCVSPNYLSTKLKEETGKTYITHLTECRISHAKELLEKTNLTAKTIGKRVGYPDAIYFTRVFKKQTGMTPAEYRSKRGKV